MVQSSPPTARSFVRELALRGWSGGSSWGFDDVYESYWAELHQASQGRRTAGLRIGPERLLVTVGALAGVVAHAAGVADDEAFLALTA